METRRVLVVDDDAEWRRQIRLRLTEATGSDIVEAESGKEAIAKVQEQSFDLVLLDVRLPDLDGIEVLARIRQSAPQAGIVMMTAYGSGDLMAQAFKTEATDFLDKSTEFLRILPIRIEKILRDLHERAYLRSEVYGRYQLDSLIAESSAMKEVFRLIDKVAPTNATVLVQGESGTGKELVARAIHCKSSRSSKPFVAVNCAAMPEGLLESELFGHVRGAFTGAVRDNEGKFEQANEGTVFLDEVGDMSASLQAKVLRVLQEQTFTRVGGTRPTTVDVRVIAATNKDLKVEIGKGSFREDLYYRLAEFPVFLPPLRDRGEDIMLLVEFFIERHAYEVKKKVTGISAEAMEALFRYSFPGNVRELSSIIKRAIILEDPASEKITINSLPAELIYLSRDINADTPLNDLPHQQAKETFERKYLQGVLQKANGNISQAARLAKMDRNNFKDKLKKHGIQMPHETGQ
jgi:DNA-binding NtrC family response regulator